MQCAHRGYAQQKLSGVEVMRYTEIDGMRCEIRSCNSCPFFEEYVGCPPECKYPSSDVITLLSMETCYGGIDAKCPLREVE